MTGAFLFIAFLSTGILALIHNLGMANIFTELDRLRRNILDSLGVRTSEIRSDIADAKQEIDVLRDDTLSILATYRDEIRLSFDAFREETRVTLSSITETLSRIEAVLVPPDAVSIVFYELVGGELREITMAQMKAGEKKTIVIKAKDAFGNLTKVENASCSLADPSIGSVVLAEDGLSGEITSAGPAGSTKVQYNADGHIGDGEAPVAGELPLDVIPGDAVTVELALQD